jgi:hypothetical protein
MDEFLNSKAMFTPGMAGAATTVLTGTLASVFGFRGDITALVISFMFGLLVLAEHGVPLLQRAIFYVLNSITIFSVAIGLNQAGVEATKSTAQAQYEQRWVSPEGGSDKFFRSWF